MSGPSTPASMATPGTSSNPQSTNPNTNRNPVAVLIPKWRAFVNQAKAGQLAPESAKAVRGILKAHIRNMMLQGFIAYKVNIYDDLPPALDPRVAWNSQLPTLSMEDYERESRMVLNEISRIVSQKASGGGGGAGASTTGSPNTATSNAGAATSLGANTPTPAGQFMQAQGGSSPAFSSAASSPNPSHQARPQMPANVPSPTPSLQQAAKTIAPNTTATGPGPNVRPNLSAAPNPNSNPNAGSPARSLFPPGFEIPPNVMQMGELRQYINIKDPNERNATLNATPGLKARYDSSLEFYQTRQRNNALAQQGQATSARPVRPAGESSTLLNGGSSTPGAGPSTASPSATMPTNVTNPPPGQTANPTNAAPQRPPKPNASTSNTKASQAQGGAQGNAQQQSSAGQGARGPLPIRPATPPVNQSTNNVRPPANVPTPSAASTSTIQTKPTSTPSQAQPGAAANPNQPQSNPGPPGPSQSQPPPQSQPPQPQPGQNPHPIPNPHHNQLNYPPPSFNPSSTFAGAPPRSFDLTLPPQRYMPPSQPAPPPPPPELESDRRKRKIGEYLAEIAPGMELESGVHDVISEYLDMFIEDSVEGAIRLSKHRKNAKVDLKDMALAIDMKHDFRVPGFNVQLPQKTYVPVEGERRRGKAVVPRAAKKN